MTLYIIAVFWIIIGIILTEIYGSIKSFFKSKHRIKILKAIEGIYIASVKDKPKITNAIIEVNRKKDSIDVIEFSGTSCKASDYTGTILINTNNPCSGSGNYIHKSQNLKRGEFIGFGTIEIIIKSESLIAVNQTFQRNNIDVHNAEVWRRVEGDDIGKSALNLKKKYMQLNKQYTQQDFVVV